MSTYDGQLVVTITCKVKEEHDRKDPNLEIDLRSIVVKARELIELIGRGKFDVHTSYERKKPTTKRRRSERASK